MVGLYLIQVTFLLCSITCVDGQALYEEKCMNKIVRDVQQFYDKDVELQTQVNDVKDQLSSCRETVGFLQFQLRCLNEKGIYQEQSVTKNQYCFMRLPLTWNGGKTKCLSIGGYLLQIETKSEQTWLNERASILVGTWWMGAVLDTAKNVWVWDHSGSAINFTNWHRLEPNGEGLEKCALVRDADLWQDYPCSDKYYIICERK